MIRAKRLTYFFRHLNTLYLLFAFIIGGGLRLSMAWEAAILRSAMYWARAGDVQPFCASPAVGSTEAPWAAFVRPLTPSAFATAKLSLIAASS